MRASERTVVARVRHAVPLGARTAGPRRRHAARGFSAADIRWFEVNPCYVFHPLNSYDVASEGDSIVLDVVRHPSVFTAVQPVPGNPALDRWTVDLTAGQVTEERIDDTAQEFPRVDERLVGRPYRYGYSVGFSPDAAGISAPDAILKHDLATRRTQSSRLRAPVANPASSSSSHPVTELPKTTVW